MSNMYDDFEKRYADKWFSAGWVEVEVKPQQAMQAVRKDIKTLEAELEEINEAIESIAQKQLRLSNLAKLYDS